MWCFPLTFGCDFPFALGGYFAFPFGVRFALALGGYFAFTFGGDFPFPFSWCFAFAFDDQFTLAFKGRFTFAFGHGLQLECACDNITLRPTVFPCACFEHGCSLKGNRRSIQGGVGVRVRPVRGISNRGIRHAT